MPVGRVEVLQLVVWTECHRNFQRTGGPPALVRGLLYGRSDMANDVGDGHGRQRRWAGVPVLATVLLAMLMGYSMMLIHCGVPWQFAVAIPVSLATATVQLVRQMYSAGDSRRRPRRARAVRATAFDQGVGTSSSAPAG